MHALRPTAYTGVLHAPRVRCAPAPSAGCPGVAPRVAAERCFLTLRRFHVSPKSTYPGARRHDARQTRGATHGLSNATLYQYAVYTARRALTVTFTGVCDRMCGASPPSRIFTTANQTICAQVDAARGQMRGDIAARRPTRRGYVSLTLQPTTWRGRRPATSSRACASATSPFAPNGRFQCKNVGLFHVSAIGQKTNTYFGYLPNEKV